MKKHVARFTDIHIVLAYDRTNMMIQSDAPTELELIRVRNQLPLNDCEIISLNWLRNRIVCLRKENKLGRWKN